MSYSGLLQVISGAQSGADIAGLRAAKKFGIKTGGLVPKGFRTTEGPKPEWAEEFGLLEHASADYRPRTIENVKEADGTVILSYDFDSPGTRLTANKALELSRPRLCIALSLYHSEEQGKWVAEWITNREISVLNVAGNSNRYANIEERVFEILCHAFRRLGFKEQS